MVFRGLRSGASRGDVASSQNAFNVVETAMNGCTVPPFIHAPLTATSLHACILMAFSAVCSRLNRNCHNHTDLQRSPPPRSACCTGWGRGWDAAPPRLGPPRARCRRSSWQGQHRKPLPFRMTPRRPRSLQPRLFRGDLCSLPTATSSPTLLAHDRHQHHRHHDSTTSTQH